MENAYTYLIGWSRYNLWYYGCRYAKNSSPADLWVTYFTSSKLVKQKRIELGEPDIIKITKRFNNRKHCIEWEERFLRKVKAVQSKQWLNQAINGKVYLRDNGKMSEEHKRKLSLSNKGKHSGKRKPHTQETKDKIKNKRIGLKFSDEWKQNLRKPKDNPRKITPELYNTLSKIAKGKLWYNDGFKNYRLLPDNPLTDKLFLGMK